MYIFNSYLADKLYLYIDIKRKLGFKFKGQLPILKKLDRVFTPKGYNINRLKQTYDYIYSLLK